MDNMFTMVIYLFILAIIFDISLNLRRLLKSLDRLWRKLAEISESLEKKPL